MNELPSPLTPEDCDLRDFPFLPMDIARLFNSEFHARADDTAWRAGVTLWLKSFHQVPSGSIPDDDISLARLAELGRDVKTWKKIKSSALYGWVKCSDGRLYHPVVAQKASEAWKAKLSQRARTGKARLQAMLSKLLKASDSMEFAHLENNVEVLLSELSQGLSQTEFDAIKKSVTDSVTESKRKRKGEREGQGEGERDFNKKNSVPDGTGGEPPKSAEQMTKSEIWTAGKSLLISAGVPAAQCGSFVGKLCKDYGDEIVVEAVRSAVVLRPADPQSFLVATCQKEAGQRKTTAPWWSSDASILQEGAKHKLAPYPGENMNAFKSRVEAAIDKEQKPKTDVPAEPKSQTVPQAEPEPKRDMSPEAMASRSAALHAAKNIRAASLPAEGE